MTTIQKLQIQGIRSFSPLKPNVIEFYKPLTIIVGHNGAGKTVSIQESMKNIKFEFNLTFSFPLDHH